MEYCPAAQNKEPAKEDRYKDVRCDDEHIYEDFELEKEVHIYQNLPRK